MAFHPSARELRQRDSGVHCRRWGGRVTRLNATIPGDASHVTISSLFEDQVDRAPEATALRYDGGSLTYRELDERANRLAHLLKQRGVVRDTPVALCLERSPDSIVTVIAILKAGGVYVPLEPTYPRERLAFMVRDVGAALLVTSRDFLPQLPRDIAPVLLIDDGDADRANWSHDRLAGAHADSTDRAYVMYTSGSTGTPKGVEVVHRAIRRLVCDVDYVTLGADCTVLHAAPLAFDASTFEIWGALLTGGTCALYHDRIPSGPGIRRAIADFGVTTMWLTAGLFNSIVDDNAAQLAGVNEILVGGEALSVSHVRQAQEALPGVRLINGYGPTETTTFAATHPVPRPLPADATSVPIGRPIRDTYLYVLDAEQRPVPVGMEGELYIGGDGCARGYVGRPDLTAERFLADPFRGDAGARMYRTSDIVRQRPDGAVEYLGRSDTQVKISGYRIELGEIEAALLRHPAVRTCVVVARQEDDRSTKQLVAYVVPHVGEVVPNASALRKFLGETLPAYMLPVAVVPLRTVPLTGNGKVDHRALPTPALEHRAAEGPYAAPRTENERAVAGVWAGLLGMHHVGIDDNVFDLGASSLLVVRAAAILRKTHGLTVPVVRFYEQPRIVDFAAGLDAASKESRPSTALDALPAPSRETSHAIAIIGMAARYPGADTVDEFWRNLCDGRESITRFTDDELDADVHSSLRLDPQYVRARGVLRNVGEFDAGFFGMSPREAELMDPQQRIFLELAWTALEHAGQVPSTDSGPIGVFAGVYNNSYASTVLARRPDVVEGFGVFNTMLLNEKDYVASRAAHKLGLTGPALSIHTACSTSLVTLCQAVQSLRAGQCDVALAGGVSLNVPTNSGYLYQEGSMLSADGSTRPFDARSTGTVFSDGAGVVVLKRLVDAERDGNTIYAIVRGVGVNNDGALKASFTAPSVAGQRGVIEMAQRDANVEPRSISYVEAHGTATPLGDPIEFEALSQVFRARTADSGFCGLGSVKSNMGHTVIAAGAAGVIKTALALAHQSIPATLHFTAPNPNIDVARSPFYVTSSATPWPRGDTPRRAGVSSFGVGGTNAHVVLEEGPLPPASSACAPAELIVLSARTPKALDQATSNLVAHLNACPELSLADVSNTLQTGRRAFQHRRSLAATSRDDAVRALEERDDRRLTTRQSTLEPSVVFMFPGQGSQYVRMGAELYAERPVFRDAFDRCATAAGPILGFDLHELLHATGEDEEAPLRLRQTSVTQPALFAVEYALANLWMSWGVKPVAMLGHSIGEFVAAAVAGVFALEDAVRIVAERGRMMQAMPGGTMLSVRLPAAQLARLLDSDLSIASDNAPNLCVVSGPSEKVAALQASLERTGVVCRSLQTSHAFHSSMMDPVVEPLTALLRSVSLSAPSIPFVSSVTGDWITASEACDANYWAGHLRHTVNFAGAASTVLALPGPLVLLETGPRASLATLVRQQVTDRARQICVSSLGSSGEATAEPLAVLAALGELWAAGVIPDWPAVNGSRRLRRIPLPTYPFERRLHWVAPLPRVAAPSDIAAPAPAASLIQVATNPTSTENASIATVFVARETTAIQSSIIQMPGSAIPRSDRLLVETRDVLERISGLDFGADEVDTAFLELGLDSLVLTQAAIALTRAHGVKITFRQLIEEHTTLGRLTAHLDRSLPADAPAPVAATASAPGLLSTPAHSAGAAMNGDTPGDQSRTDGRPFTMSTTTASPVTGALQQLIEQQLHLMTQQLALLSGASGGAAASVPLMTLSAETLLMARPPMLTANTAPPLITTPESITASIPGGVESESLTTGPQREVYDAKRAFGAAPRITVKAHEELTPRQRARLEAFIRRYTARTRSSKRFTQENRSQMADPRVVSGFRPAVKELVYPLVMQRSAGSRMWDLDDNEYLDVSSGFGSNLFGWSAPFVIEAVKAQLDKGFDVGPQHALAGEVAHLFCEITGHERTAFCNTGSEAVLGAMRIARTVTGRDLIVLFSGAYHGIIDEVIVRATKKGTAIPAAPGIMRAATENVLVLEYGTPESLEIIRARANELAAVIVEPVQSRRPDFQPAEFLQALRTITSEAGAVYIWDEIVTGFRVAPGGAQEHFGVRADLATYGKVVGGGLPIGIIAGKREFMDALDGGAWRFGDASVPEIGVTYFAGTFVRHPLALAAARAVLLHLQAQGPELQRGIAAHAERLEAELNEYFKSEGLPLEIRRFSSLWKTFFTADQQHGDLLFYMLRDRGIHIFDGFPCFMTAAHSDADVDKLVNAFKEATTELREGGFIRATEARAVDVNVQPVPGARLGRDRDGAPAWFIAKEGEPETFVRV